MDIGDLPGWGALALSIYTFFRSSAAEKRTAEAAKFHAHIASMKDDINMLKKLSFQYWLSDDTGNTPTALEIKGLLKTIPNKAKRYPHVLPLIQADFIQLRIAISGGDFEVLNRPALLSSSPRIVQMNEILTKIISQIESL